jgi:hypothetical protein
MTEIHIVSQGECLSSIGKTYGFTSWQTIYEDAQNADFKKKRPNPNQIYPGDELFIPDRQLKEVDRVTEKKHRFKVKTLPILVRLVVKDENWKPFLGKNYELKFASLPKPFSGATSGSDGKIEHPQSGEPAILPDVEEAELSIWLNNGSLPPAVWKLKFGYLDPVEELAGVQKRLANLGFPVGAPDGQLNDSTKAALTSFQALVGINQSGDSDQETRDALAQNHDKLCSKNESLKSVPFVTRATAYVARLRKNSPTAELSATLSFQRFFRFSI